MVDGTTYYASQTVGGCESDTRLAVTANVSDPAAPTGASPQSFCSIDNPTVADLSATGTAIQWYAAATGGAPLAGGTALVDGTIYYATQTVGGCESDTRLAVTANVSDPAAPTGASPQSFCAIDNPTVADLSATGTAIQWYAAATGGAPLAGGTALVDGTIYYASQTVGGCESDTRLAVLVTLEAAPTAPSSGGDQIQCEESPIQTLTASATAPPGSSVVWYDAASGGSVVASPTLNSVGTITYYAESENSSSGCISTTRTAVTLTIDNCDLVTGKTVNNNAPNEGDTIIYTLTLTNNGLAQVTNLSITDLLPAGVTYVSDDGAGAYVSGTGLWTIGTLKQWCNGYLKYYSHSRCRYQWQHDHQYDHGSDCRPDGQQYYG